MNRQDFALCSRPNVEEIVCAHTSTAHEQMNKDVKEVYDFALSLGFELQRYNGHYHMKHPNGAHVTIPGSPSDHKALKNTMADIRRVAGVRRQRSGRGGQYSHKKGTGFVPEKSEGEQQARGRIDEWLRRVAEIDCELAEIKRNPAGRMRHAEELIRRRADLADLLQRKHQPVPEINL